MPIPLFLIGSNKYLLAKMWYSFYLSLCFMRLNKLRIAANSISIYCFMFWQWVQENRIFHVFFVRKFLIMRFAGDILSDCRTSVWPTSYQDSIYNFEGNHKTWSLSKKDAFSLSPDLLFTNDVYMTNCDNTLSISKVVNIWVCIIRRRICFNMLRTTDVKNSLVSKIRDLLTEDTNVRQVSLLWFAYLMFLCSASCSQVRNLYLVVFCWRRWMSMH